MSLKIPEVDRAAEPDAPPAEPLDLDTSAALRASELSDRRQRRTLRWTAFVIAVLAVIGFAVYAGLAFLAVTGAAAGDLSPAAQSALLIAPAVALTTIVVFLLIGAFRGFADEAGATAPTADIASRVLRNLS